jgi:hypothetical protein
MFKKTILSLILASVLMIPANLALAQQSTAKVFIAKQPCDVLPKIIEVVKGYKEDLLFMGKGMSFAAQSSKSFMGGMMFFTNQDTGTWSMLQLYGDCTACLVMNGKDFAPYGGPTIPKIDEN